MSQTMRKWKKLMKQLPSDEYRSPEYCGIVPWSIQEFDIMRYHTHSFPTVVKTEDGKYKCEYCSPEGCSMKVYRPFMCRFVDPSMVSEELIQEYIHLGNELGGFVLPIGRPDAVEQGYIKRGYKIHVFRPYLPRSRSGRDALHRLQMTTAAVAGMMSGIHHR